LSIDGWAIIIPDIAIRIMAKLYCSILIS